MIGEEASEEARVGEITGPSLPISVEPNEPLLTTAFLGEVCSGRQTSEKVTLDGWKTYLDSILWCRWLDMDSCWHGGDWGRPGVWPFIQHRAALMFDTSRATGFLLQLSPSGL